MPEGLPEGTVTVLFTDVVGSTGLRTSRGDAAAQEIMHAHDDLVRQQIERHSGQEVKTIGDSFMVAFASARKAVECAVAVQRALEQHNRRHPDQSVEVRAGLNTGEVVREGNDLFGAAVDAAKRVESKAEPGQVLVSEAVRAVIGPVKDLTFVDRGRFRLKGFPERWRLYEVVWREEPPAAGASIVIERTPFVGREAERAELRRCLDQVAGGRGALVMIGGEPGVGKTRLAEELMAEARQRGMTALIGHCYEMEGAPPYIPIVEALEAAARTVAPEAFRAALGDAAGEVARIMPELRRIFPDIPPPLELPPEQERRYLFNSVREFIERAGRAWPLVLVLDDLHWADDSTMLLVQHLAQGIHEAPVLLLGTYRDVELEVARPLARTIRELTRQRLLHRLALKRLPKEGVSAMLQALSGHDPPGALVQAIFGETEGNPFFVEEVFHHFAEEGRLFDAQGRWRADLEVSELDVPEGVRLVITERLEHVSDECRRVLTSAAVIGRAFTFELLEALGDAEPDALLDCVDEAERAHLITAAADGSAQAGAGTGEARFSFAHELIRQTLVSGLSLPRRQRVHLRIAEAIERVYARSLDERSADLAHHLYQAGAAADSEKTARYLTLAGDQASAAVAFEDALRHYDDALSLLSTDGRRGRADLLYKRGHTLRRAGRWEEALADWQAALAAYEGLDDAETVGRVCWDMSWQLAWTNRTAEGEAVARRGLAVLGEQASAYRCRLLAVAGVNLSLGADHASADGMITEALEMAEALGDQRLLGQILTYKTAHHYYFMRMPEVIDAGLRAAELLRSAGDPWDVANVLWYPYFALQALGRLDEAAKMGDELEPLATRVGHLGALMVAGHARADCELMLTGEVDSYGEFARADIELCQRTGFPWVSNSHGMLGNVHFWRGRWQEAIENHEEAARLEPPGFLAGANWGGLFLTRAYVGDSDSALAMLEESRGNLPRPGQANRWGAWVMLVAVVEGLAVLGERDEAAQLYPLTLDAIATGVLAPWGGLRLLETTAGIAAACGGQWEKAEEHFQTALRQAHELPHKIEQPEVRRWYARMLIDRAQPGDRDKARELLTEAVAMYRQMGMPKHVEMAERMLREV